MNQEQVGAARIAAMFTLAGKTALVTGGAIGMGHAAGLALAAAACRVVLADSAERIAALSDLPDGVSATVLDIADPASIRTAIQDTLAALGSVDILVNAAGLHHNRPLLDITVDEWDQVQDANLRGAFLCAQAVIPSMQARGSGRIINISTIGSVHPVLNSNGAYSASRAGLNQLSRNIALEFAKDGITANTVLPGAIVTEAIKSDFRPTGPGADPARHLGGYGKPEDIAGVALLLAGPAGRYITGQAIAVDGGFLVS